MSAKICKKILITGCARSGTKYSSVLLRKIGIEVFHEIKMGNDGISSWLFGVKNKQTPWGPPTNAFEFENIVHLTRNPLCAIPSITTLNKESWEYIANNTPISNSEPIILRAAKYWLYWNEIIEQKANLRIKIENMPQDVKVISEKINKSVDLSKIDQVPVDLSTRKYGRTFHLYETLCLRLNIVFNNKVLKSILAKKKLALQNITWHDLEKLDLSLSKDIYEKANRYGY